ncbi:MAG: aconitate hydratase AcnA [Candidatus Lokiarchaeota archaeon]|nr:aconitate hydratase AcnA [Candidatus Lokiarchaeota archaeon]
MDEIEIKSKVKEVINSNLGEVSIFNIQILKELDMGDPNKLPYSHKILLENLLRNLDGDRVKVDHLLSLCKWDCKSKTTSEIPFIPSRVLLQDFTGVPAVVDLAALRSAMKRLGGDPSKINPIIPVDLVIDHSIQVDYYGTKDAIKLNEKKEMERNRERYTLLKWAQEVFQNFRVVPTSRGICHQVNLEYLASVVHIREENGEFLGYPDTLVGTDSHTTMINGLAVLGWGVGGIEAEAVILGRPYYMNIPKVVGVKLIGEIEEGITATDIVLRITQILRNHGVVGKFVEFYGTGLKKLYLADRATIANMAPEYGATMGFFPTTEETLKYLRESGRKEDHVDFIEQYAKKVGLFYTDDAPTPNYSENIEIDLSEIERNLAGPKRPQDRMLLSEMKNTFVDHMKTVFNKSEEHEKISDGKEISHGSVVIAAITSCTNTSNPSVMIGAGLLARNAVKKGLNVRNFVKTSFAPGSRVVIDYLNNAGLMQYLEELGFNLVGYGCTTCIGNSGPLNKDLVNEIEGRDLVAASVLSGNRNFEGRINPHTKANYLASPPLVVAFALAGTVAINMEKEPLGSDPNGNPVYLKDIWPSSEEIIALTQKFFTAKLFNKEYGEIFEGWDLWNQLKPPKEEIYQWDENSTYIREPPFFINFPLEKPPLKDMINSRALALLGDSVTTDHISPAGAIPEDMPAGKYLISKGINPKDFNSFGSRRGNHEVMMRGTFGNIRIKNKLVDREGGWTLNFLSNETVPIYEAAMDYIPKKIPLIILAGKDYGMGSSRDWAAKGTQLLGVTAVIAESFERIHRNNLVGMGVLPLQFRKGENPETLGLDGTESFDIAGVKDIKPFSEVLIKAKKENGKEIQFDAIVRLDSNVDIEYYRNGGILHTVLRQMIKY